MKGLLVRDELAGALHALVDVASRHVDLRAGAEFAVGNWLEVTTAVLRVLVVARVDGAVVAVVTHLLGARRAHTLCTEVLLRADVAVLARTGS